LSILRCRTFYRNIEDLQTILEPIKKVVVTLEHKSTTLVECFIHLVKLGVMIKEFPSGNILFKEQCQEVFDKRWGQFNFELYLLAFFLHPQHRGMHLFSRFISSRG
jgi:hypothetical protein